MSRDDACLVDILESARAANEYVRGKSWDKFKKDSLVQDAVVRRLEIIGEASGRVFRGYAEEISVSAMASHERDAQPSRP